MSSLLLLPALTTLLFPQDPPTAAVEHLISDTALRAPLRFLADDLLEGRGVASRGDQLARLYLATQMQLFGLEVQEQSVPVLGITSKVTTTLTAKGKTGTHTFAAPSEFTATAACREAETAWGGQELVFVGYGIHAPEQSWDDFKGIDLKGKVLLVMNNDPSEDPRLFAGKTRLYYGRWTYKYEEAARRGAAGAIVIHTEVSAGYPFQVIQATHGKETFFLPFEPGEATLPIRSWCSEAAARQLCALGGQDLDALRKQAETREFKPVPLGVKLDLALENTFRDLRSANVLGKLTGSDPKRKEEAIIVTAHFDHLGIGPEKKGDPIYNGALDNASGTAALLALARAVAALEPRPARTIWFAAVTGEESGLFGSEYLAKHLPIPRRKVIANYNIDGINIWGPTKDLQMIGHGKNTLTDLSETVAAARGREIRPDSEPDRGYFYRSDHFSFARVGIPSAYFKAGDRFLENPEGRARVKAMFTTVHYHQPSDEYDARFVLDGAVQDLRLIAECLVRSANAADEPSWKPGDEFARLREAPEPPREGDFLRFTETGNDEGILEVALPTYRNEDGVTVTLISAVHIADGAHYAVLNAEFRKYEAMLYELVAAEGTRPDPDSRDRSPISMIQNMLKSSLELEFQLEGIDYTPANFVHADLSPAEFKREMRRRGETILTIIGKQMLAGMQMSAGGQVQQVDLVKAFRNKQGRHTMRLNFARQFNHVERMVSGLGAGNEEGSALLEGRNQKAIEVLVQQVAAGRKNLAIYYGAAHMPDMEKRLFKLGYQKIGERWLVAWDVHKRFDK